jgi:type I restriction enzyme M protein
MRKRDAKTRFALATQYTQSEMILREPQVEYVTSPKKLDEFMLDEHGHLIVKHDLFNHDGLTRDGIAEAFAEFAKKERLSFF